MRACPVCSHTDESTQPPVVADSRTAEEERELLAALRRSHDEAAHALEMLQEVRRQRDAALATIDAERVTAAARERSLFDLLSAGDTAQAELRRLVAQAAATPRLTAEPRITTIVESEPVEAGPAPEPVEAEPAPVPVEGPVTAAVVTPEATPRRAVEFAMPRPVPVRRRPAAPAPEPRPEIEEPVGSNGGEEPAELDGRRSWWPRARPHSPLDEFYLD